MAGNGSDELIYLLAWAYLSRLPLGRYADRAGTEPAAATTLALLRTMSPTAVVVTLAVGVLCLIAFPWWERRTSHPMMPLGIFAAHSSAAAQSARSL